MKMAKVLKMVKLYFMITVSITIMAVGVYFFKFPNNFCFGGVTGMATAVAEVTPISASLFTAIVNTVLLVAGWIFIGREFAFQTTYASILLSLELMVLEKVYPMTEPLSHEPVLDLMFAIALPAIASALLFYLGASSGGTDVLALIVKKYTGLKDLGIALLLVDLVMVIVACFVFDVETALYSFVGLTMKSMVIDNINRRITLCKSIMIICDDTETICKYIIEVLDKSATLVPATGAYTGTETHIIFTTLTRAQATQLQHFIHENNLHAFISMASTTEVFGKGFTAV